MTTMKSQKPQPGQATFTVRKRGKKTKTRYTGIYQLEHLAGKDITYTAMYRRDGKLIEDKIGRKSEGWNPRSASEERTLRIKGVKETHKERRNREQAQLEAKTNRWTFDKLFSYYCEVKSENRGLPNDRYRYAKHLQTYVGDKTPEELTSLDVERIRKRLRKVGYGETSVWHVAEIIRRMANFSEKQGLGKGLSFRLSLSKVNNQKTESLTPKQLGQLHKVLLGESLLGNPAAFMIRLVLASGMRRGELFRLKFSDINEDHILLRGQKSGKDTWIPLNAAAHQILKEIPKTGSEFVFPGRNAKQRDNASKALRTIKKKAGLPEDFRILHGCRHVFASTGVSNGIDLYTMQHLLTHKSPAMTQRYAHLADDHLKRASEHTALILAGGNMENVIDLGGNRQKRQA